MSGLLEEAERKLEELAEDFGLEDYSIEPNYGGVRLSWESSDLSRNLFVDNREDSLSIGMHVWKEYMRDGALEKREHEHRNGIDLEYNGLEQGLKGAILTVERLDETSLSEVENYRTG